MPEPEEPEEAEEAYDENDEEEYDEDERDSHRYREQRSFSYGRYDRGPNIRWAVRGQRLAGVEVEFNTCTTEGFENQVKPWCRKWGAQVHPDGSCGSEAVTSPAAGENLVAQLKELFEALSKATAVADSNCGIHVHVDTRDFGWADMFRLCRIYSLTEPVLYLLGGQHRVNNHYSTPWGPKLVAALKPAKPQILKERFCEAVFGTYQVYDSVGRAKNDPNRHLHRAPGKKDGNRYRGLNLVPWVSGKYFRGNGKMTKAPRSDTTVEFRIHENSLDCEEVTEWARLVVNLVSWAKRQTARDTNKFIAAMKGDSAKALIAISPESKDWILRKIKSWRRKYKHYSRGDSPSVSRRIFYRPDVGWTIGRAPPRRAIAPELRLAV